MKTEEEQIARLREGVEKMVGRKIGHPKDFTFLSKQVEGYVGEKISASTLKRVWGYVATNGGVSHFTLDLLSKMIGYECWDSFCQEGEVGVESSHRMVLRKLFTSALTPGDQIELVWKPERKVTVRFEGSDLFIVLESQNSKLQKDDIFHCLQFVEHEPLTLFELYRKGMPPCDYICGRQGGIVWNLIPKEEA